MEVAGDIAPEIDRFVDPSHIWVGLPWISDTIGYIASFKVMVPEVKPNSFCR